MKISAKIDYACRAVLELALHWPQTTPLQINTIADNQHIPIQFLPHILIQLKQQGYVESIRGKKGGYLLARSPKEIKLNDVVKAFAEVQVRPKNSGKAKKVDTLGAIWQEMNQVIIIFLNNITFEDIVRRHRRDEKVLMYTI